MAIIKTNNRNYRLFFYKILTTALTVLMLYFIWSNSSSTATQSNVQSQKMSETILNLFTAFFPAQTDPASIVPVLRKLAHFAEFAALGTAVSLVFFAFRLRLSASLGYILFFSLFTAVIDEYIQFFIEGRASMVQDVLIDFAGAVSGILFALLLRFFCKTLYNHQT